jgi:hypothetical protein
MLTALQTLPRGAELLAFGPDAWPATISAELAEETGPSPTAPHYLAAISQSSPARPCARTHPTDGVPDGLAASHPDSTLGATE